MYYGILKNLIFIMVRRRYSISISKFYSRKLTSRRISRR
jgi:hypothetical protein